MVYALRRDGSQVLQNPTKTPSLSAEAKSRHSMFPKDRLFSTDHTADGRTRIVRAFLLARLMHKSECFSSLFAAASKTKATTRSLSPAWAVSTSCTLALAQAGSLTTVKLATKPSEFSRVVASTIACHVFESLNSVRISKAEPPAGNGGGIPRGSSCKAQRAAGVGVVRGESTERCGCSRRHARERYAESARRSFLQLDSSSVRYYRYGCIAEPSLENLPTLIT